MKGTGGAAAWGGAIGGLDSGVFATVVSLIGEKTDWSDLALSAFAGSGFLGTFLATLAGGVLADRYGRKRLILAGTILYAVGSLGLLLGLCADEFYFVGRFLSGIGLGFLYFAVPLYLSENSPATSRGRRVGLFQLLMVVGIFAGAVFALGCRQLWPCLVLPGALSVVLTLVLMRLPADATGRIVEVSSGPLSSVLSSRAFWLVLAVGMLVPLSGIGPVLDYSVTIFKRAGLDGLGANGVDVLVKGVNLAMTFPALFLVDRIGRRALMIGGALVMMVALAVTAFAFRMGGTVGALLAAGGCVFYIAAFAVGPGVCMWLVIPESLPQSIRAKGMSAALLADYLAVTAIMTVFLPLTAHVGLGGGFSLLAVFSALLMFVSVFLLKETTGRVL